MYAVRCISAVHSTVHVWRVKIAPIGTRTRIVSFESGALPASPFPAGTLIVCRAVYLFVHCAHFITLSNPFHYTCMYLYTCVLCNYLHLINWYIRRTVIASNLLLVDEIMRAGLSSLKGNAWVAYTEYTSRKSHSPHLSFQYPPYALSIVRSPFHILYTSLDWTAFSQLHALLFCCSWVISWFN